MVEEKMTYVLVSTEKFIATITYPVKTKVIETISKHVTEAHEYTDAILEITPVLHTATKEKMDESLAYRFYKMLTYPASSIYSRNKQHEMQHLIDLLGPKVCHELEDLHETMNTLGEMNGHIDRVIVNLLDKSGNSVDYSHMTTVLDVWKALDAFSFKLRMQPSTKKVPLFLIHAESGAGPKPRHKERAKEHRDSGVRRHSGTASLKVA